MFFLWLFPSCYTATHIHVIQYQSSIIHADIRAFTWYEFAVSVKRLLSLISWNCLEILFQNKTSLVTFIPRVICITWFYYTKSTGQILWCQTLSIKGAWCCLVSAWILSVSGRARQHVSSCWHQSIFHELWRLHVLLNFPRNEASSKMNATLFFFSDTRDMIFFKWYT